MAIFGLSFLVYSLFETRAHGELFFARDRYCIERFRKAEKAADVAACCHNVAKGHFGLLMMLLGLTRPLQREMDMDGMYVIAFILFFLDILWRVPKGTPKQAL